MRTLSVCFIFAMLNQAQYAESGFYRLVTFIYTFNQDLVNVCLKSLVFYVVYPVILCGLSGCVVSLYLMN